VAFGQSLMNGTNDLIIGQDDVSMWHPGFMQIFDLCCDQPVTEAALQASGSNHAASLRTGTDWLSTMGGEMCPLPRRRTKKKYRFDCCVVDLVLIRIWPS